VVIVSTPRLYREAALPSIAIPETFGNYWKNTVLAISPTQTTREHPQRFAIRNQRSTSAAVLQTFEKPFIP